LTDGGSDDQPIGGGGKDSPYRWCAPVMTFSVTMMLPHQVEFNGSDFDGGDGNDSLGGGGDDVLLGGGAGDDAFPMAVPALIFSRRRRR
jgi:Ca2+-binding RTX toxin-like protein